MSLNEKERSVNSMSWCQAQYKNPTTGTIHTLFILVLWLYSGMHVLARPALDYLPPYVFAAIRLLVGMPFVYLLSLKEKRVELTWGDSARLAMLGFFGIGVAQTMVFAANKLVGAGIVAMMLPLATIFTVVLSGILGMERVGPLKAIGVTVAVGGSVAIAWVTESDFQTDTAWGVAMMFFEGISWSIYLIMMAKFLKSKPIPLYAYFRAALWGLIFTLPACALQISEVKWSEVPYWVWLVEIYCGVAVSGGAHVMMSWLIKHCASFWPALYTGMQPLITVMLAQLALHERFNVWLILCMFSIVGGFLLVIAVKAKEHKQAFADKGSNEKEDASGREPLLPTKGSLSHDGVDGDVKAELDSVVSEQDVIISDVIISDCGG